MYINSPGGSFPRHDGHLRHHAVRALRHRHGVPVRPRRRRPSCWPAAPRQACRAAERHHPDPPAAHRGHSRGRCRSEIQAAEIERIRLWRRPARRDPVRSSGQPARQDPPPIPTATISSQPHRPRMIGTDEVFEYRKKSPGPGVVGRTGRLLIHGCSRHLPVTVEVDGQFKTVGTDLKTGSR